MTPSAQPRGMESAWGAGSARGTATVLAVSAFADLAVFVVVPVLAVYLTSSLGLSVTMVGVISTCAFASNMFGALAGGIIVDRVGAKLSMLAGLALQVLGVSLFAFSTQFPVLCLLYACAGLGYSLFTTASQAELSALVGRDGVDAVFSKRAVASNLGISLGVLVGGVLLQGDIPRLAFAIAAGLAVVNAAFVAVLVPGRVVGTDEEPLSVRKMLQSALKDRAFLGFNLSVLGVWVIYALYLLNIPLFVDKAFPHVNVGVIYLVNTLAIVALQVPLIRWLARVLSSPRIIAIGAALILGAYLVLWRAQDPWLLFAAVFVFTIGEILTLPLIPSHVSRIAPAESVGSYLGVTMVGRYLGFAIGNILGGWLADKSLAATGGVREAWLGYALIAVVALIALAPVVVRGPRQEATAAEATTEMGG